MSRRLDARRALRAGWLGAAALLIALGAGAGQKEENAARSLFAEGNRLYVAHDYAAALDKFHAAYGLWANPKILPNIGSAAWELGRFVEACDAYDRYLDEAPNAPDRAAVEKARDEVVARVGTLTIVVEGGEAKVTVDEEPIASGHLGRVRVTPGLHTVRAEPPSGRAIVRRAKAPQGGEPVLVTIHLRPKAPASEAPTAGPDQPAAPPVAPDDASRHSAMPWVIGGFGAASLVSSGVLYLLHKGAVEDFQSQCADGAGGKQVCPTAAEGDKGRAETLGTFSLVALGVGVAGVGVAAVLFSSGSSSAEPAARSRRVPRVSVGASAAPGGARLVVLGAF